MAVRRCFSSVMSVLLFIFSILQLLCGIAYLVFGLMLQNPPKAAVPLILVIFSCVMMLTAVFGIVSSCYSRGSCVFCYCVWGMIVTVVQLGIVLACIIDPTGITNKIVESCNDHNDCNSLTDDWNQVHDYIIVGRWVFLGWVAAQFIFLMVAIMLCTCCSKRKLARYSDLEAEKDVESARERLKAVQMQNVALEQAAAERQGGKAGKGNGSNPGSFALSSQDAAYDVNAAGPALGVPTQQGMYPQVPPAAPMGMPPAGGSAWGGKGNGAW